MLSTKIRPTLFMTRRSTFTQIIARVSLLRPSSQGFSCGWVVRRSDHLAGMSGASELYGNDERTLSGR